MKTKREGAATASMSAGMSGGSGGKRRGVRPRVTIGEHTGIRDTGMLGPRGSRDAGVSGAQGGEGSCVSNTMLCGLCTQACSCCYAAHYNKNTLLYALAALPTLTLMVTVSAILNGPE